MRETQAIIERVTRLNEHYQRLQLSVDPYVQELKPGQSFLARSTDGGWNPYLREQWWPVALTQNSLIVERPGTEVYEPGEVVSLLGFVGQPFRYKRVLRNVLLIADDTAPTPLIMAGHQLVSNKVSVTLVLGGSAVQYPTAHLPPELEVIAADDDLNWPNQVLTAGWADQVFVAVRAQDEMERITHTWQMFNRLRKDVPKGYIFAIMHPILPCGIGACAACLVALREHEMMTVCTEGPCVDMTSLPLPEAQES
jgi:hypothetical protein